MYAKVHGFEFEIDVADWGNNASCGEAGGRYLIDWLGRQSADRVAAIWAFDQLVGTEWSSSRDMPKNTAWSAKEAAEARAMKLATEGWLSQPTSGHNLSICAMPRLN